MYNIRETCINDIVPIIYSIFRSIFAEYRRPFSDRSAFGIIIGEKPRVLISEFICLYSNHVRVCRFLSAVPEHSDDNLFIIFSSLPSNCEIVTTQ